MTTVSPDQRFRVDPPVTVRAPVRTCPTCAHPRVARTVLDRLERRAKLVLGDGSGRQCRAEIVDQHEATSWGEPPCACCDRFHA